MKIIKIVRILGMGIGPRCIREASRIMEAALKKATNDTVRIEWIDAELDSTGDWESQLKNIVELVIKYKIALKAPTEKPEGIGMQSLNVALRKLLNLYACIRPINWIPGIPSPYTDPSKFDLIIYRENTEGSYVAIEAGPNTERLKEIQSFLANTWNESIRDTTDMAIGVTIVSKEASQRLMRKALQDAIALKRKRVTVGAKSNIREQVDGSFQRWCLEVVKEFGGDEVGKNQYEITKDGHTVFVDHMITDNFFQQLSLRPEEFDLVVFMNYDGDVISDTLAAAVGGIGVAGGSNKNETLAVYEATHGTWPQAAGQNRANPSAIALSGGILMEDIGVSEANILIRNAIQKAVADKKVTEDLGKTFGIPESDYLTTSEFADVVIENIENS